ncbi:MFS transporter [Candidatus Berkiella aquae]|uniref:MFS transporter n=1 Tax=Candidatus Berkiella aquae TaxID=295108 RepID=A0A0Q9YK71_9GAMM|nr:MFS transporter [Candidatus Berkiella aquae]MCS5709975.1 MFS transporter [Candidatus Berkiella aquae]
MQQRSSVTIWSMWLLASFFYAYQYILRVLPNIMMVDILEKFHIDAAIFGQYSGLYYIGYAGMHIPVGIMLDRYGPKRVLPVCMILTVMGLLPLLFAQHWIYPALGRLIIGMGSSAAILGVFKIIRMSFPEERFTLFLGFSVTIGLLGAIYGGQPVNALMHLFGWESVLQVIILLGIVMAVATFFIVPSQPIDKTQESWLASVKAVLSNPQIMLVCFLAGLMVGPLEGFADVWGKEYLKSAYHLSEQVAASLPSLIFLGMCFGSPILSWVTAKTKAYYGFIIISGLVMGAAFIWLLTGDVPVTWLAALFVIVGVFCAYQILAIYLASTFVGERLVGLTTACANMIIMTFGYVFHSAIGKIMSARWEGRFNAEGVPYYDASAYTQGLMVIPAGLILASMGYMLLASMAKKRKVIPA